ncbi:MAG: hypothetical protein DMG90_12930 [Acidobacteria bacterium]|jgi:hypothetical protein|nr:MAG: hypothetical protein DMG90_12930 [Acidobacteriota bacterium]
MHAAKGDDMNKRILLAGMLGAIAMFIWASLAHMVLPLGETGFKEIPSEQAVLNSLQASLGTQPGLYIYPGLGLPPGATREQKNEAMKAAEQKLATTPSGLLLYHPPGAEGFSARRLITEFITEMAEVLIAVFLLSQTRISSYGGRVGFIMLVGLAAVITTNVSYWNWYGFPGNYTLAYMFTGFMGYLFAGMVAAKALGKYAPVALSRAA